MTDQPDLTAELDDAGQIISGEVEKIVTEWGIRIAPGEPGEHVASVGWDEQECRQWAAAARTPCAVVKRKITYEAWQDA